MSLRHSLQRQWATRPLWLNLVWLFCLYMTFIYMPFDIFIKLFTQHPEHWEEVWFGLTLTGWAAKATEPLHWLLYGAGAYGLWKMSPWMWPWAAVYSAQITIGMVVFNLVEAKGGGPIPALVSGGLFLILTIALWRTQSLFAADSPLLGNTSDQRDPVPPNQD